MNTPCKCLLLAALAALLVPATASAQIRQFGGAPPFGYGYGFGSPYGYGWPNGFGSSYSSTYGYSSPYGYGSSYGYGQPNGYSMSPYGYGAQYGGYPNYGGGYVQPVVYSVSTASVLASTPPRMRQVAYPVAPYRATAATPGTATVEGTQARIEVRVPTESAEVWFEGVRMTQTGVERHFVTPALEPGSVYTMEVRVRWNDAGGKQQSRTERIDVRAGATQAVDFQAAR